MPNYIELPWLRCVWELEAIWYGYGGGHMEKIHFSRGKWYSLAYKTSSWNYTLHIVYSPFLIHFHFEESLFCDLREFFFKTQFLEMLTSSTYLKT